MPLVVPGLMGGSDNSNQLDEWMNKLMGKKLTEGSSDATVRLKPYLSKRPRTLINVKSFAKQDLPKEHRVLEPGAMTTQDYNPNR